MRTERDMKAKEAAAHLVVVEEKAKRVDKLESQMVLLEMDKDNLKKEVGRLKDIIEQNGDKDSLSPIRVKEVGARDSAGKLNFMTRSNRNMGLLNKPSNRVSAPLAGLIGVQGLKKTQNNLGVIGQLSGAGGSAPPKGTTMIGKKQNRQISAIMPKGKINMLAQSMRTGGITTNITDGDSDSDEMFEPPSNVLFNRAARLSVWSRSDVEGMIIDGHSSDASDDVSIKRLSDNESFTGRSSRNSIANMSRGSMSSSGSKGIRNFLGGKFK